MAAAADRQRQPAVAGEGDAGGDVGGAVAGPRAPAGARSFRSRSGTPRRTRHPRATAPPRAGRRRRHRSRNDRGRRRRHGWSWHGSWSSPVNALSGAWGPGYRRGVFQGGLAKTSSRSALARLFSRAYDRPHEQLRTVLPDRAGGADPRRALDATGAARADLRQYALQRPAARGAADVVVPALPAAQGSWSRQAWSSAGPARPGAASSTT